MSAYVRAFVVTVPAEEADIASDRLWQLGVRAVEERAADRGAVELWTAIGEDAASIERAASTLAPGWSWRCVDVDAEPADTWRATAGPVWVADDLVVVPAWQDPPSSETAEGLTVVRIEPGAAFGLGDHPATALTLRALRDALDRRPGASVLDVGCGTGVLAVAAARLGARGVRAVDTSAAAVEATIDNADRNGVRADLVVDTSPLTALDDPYDVVLANILAPALIELAPDLRRLTAPDGVLVVSGILEGRHEHVLAALEPMRAVETQTSDGWAAVRLRH